MKQPTFENLRLESDGEVLCVTIDRPDSDINAIHGGLHRDLTALARYLRSDTDARAVVITGAGSAFCAGGDYRWLQELREPGELERVRKHGKELIWDLVDTEVPIVAAVNGPAMGLGATLVLLCDAAFLASDAQIGDPHVRVGITAGDGGTAIWPLLVGPMVAKRYLLTGDPIPADEALRLGLVTHVVPTDRVLDEAMAFAHRLAGIAPLAVRSTKLAVNKWLKDALNVTFDVATAYEVVTFGSEDQTEAVAALREKRPPRFEGR